MKINLLNCQVIQIGDGLPFSDKNTDLYLISDREIKEGDWCIREYYPPTKGFTRIVQQFIRSKVDFEDSLSRMKIEATTDKNLCNKIIHGNISGQLPQIPQSFIEEFVKSNGTIKEVSIELEYIFMAYDGSIAKKGVNDCYYFENHALGSTLEIMRQQGFIETVCIKTTDNNEVIIHLPEVKTYTRDEVIKLIDNYIKEMDNFGIDRNKWIEDNL